MTLTELVKPGEKIDIMAVERAILGNSSDKKVYTSKIYDLIEDNKLEILMPMEGSKLILLPRDGEYQFCFYTENGLYQCFVRIADRYKSNNVYILLAETTSPLEKFQRREYYRYSTSIPLKVRTLMDEELRDLDKDVFHIQNGLIMKKCEIRDISGGGRIFTAPLPQQRIKACIQKIQTESWYDKDDICRWNTFYYNECAGFGADVRYEYNTESV